MPPEGEPKGRRLSPMRGTDGSDRRSADRWHVPRGDRPRGRARARGVTEPRERRDGAPAPGSGPHRGRRPEAVSSASPSPTRRGSPSSSTRRCVERERTRESQSVVAPAESQPPEHGVHSYTRNAHLGRSRNERPSLQPAPRGNCSFLPRAGRNQIPSDRDVVLQVVAKDLGPNKVPVASVCSESPVAARHDEPLDAALQRMAKEQVRRLPVVTDGHLVGMLAQADIARTGPRSRRAGWSRRSRTRERDKAGRELGPPVLSSRCSAIETARATATPRRPAVRARPRPRAVTARG
jgi:CBS domain